MTTLKEKAFDKKNSLIITLDGPSASGKGTIGRILADKLELRYVQSSILYRALAYLCVKAKVKLDDIEGILTIAKKDLKIENYAELDLSDEDIGDAASKISVFLEVRMHVNASLKKLIINSHRIIMEGRDIGTVIAPNADLKLFVTANLEVRAERRFKQLQLAGKKCIISDVLKQLAQRDLRDTSRDFAPLLIAKDALVIDSSDLNPEQVVEVVIEYLSQ